MLTIENLVAGYGKVQVLHGISLEVPEGTEELLIRLRSGDQERRRLYSPAAFGGCGEAPAAPASGDSALAMGGGEGRGEGHGAI